MRLEKPAIGHFKAMMAVDRDFENAGEEAYCGAATIAGYWVWLWTLREQAKPDSLSYGTNPNEIYFMLNDADEICGCGQFRPYDTLDVLSWAGHIGYSVPPSKRGHGNAQALLKLLLELAFERGLTEVLLTCDQTNEPSRRVIEKCGGQYVGNYTEKKYDKRQYWFYKSGYAPLKDA